jgi:hypothetical protein
MSVTLVWATVHKSKNSSKDHVRIWGDEPKWVESNNVWVGKDYLGICCMAKWPGPDFPGSYSDCKMQVAVSFQRVL